MMYTNSPPLVQQRGIQNSDESVLRHPGLPQPMQGVQDGVDPLVEEQQGSQREAQGATEGEQQPAQEVASVETEKPNQKFRWRVERFPELLKDPTDRQKRSGVFDIGGFKWELLLFPKGNSNNHGYISLFLDCADKKTLPFNWMREAHFRLSALPAPGSDKSPYVKETSHRFNENEADWGFNQFLPRAELEQGYIGLDGTLTIEAEITQQSDVNPYQPYDSKKETGFVGLKNQGATCYMNSLLQTLYHLPYFRQAVYAIPTADCESTSKSIPLALQGLFYKMQFSETSAATKDLTRSFGWDTYDSFTQHDILEFYQVLCEKLEDKMKQTPVQGTIEKLFECKILNYIECVNVDYSSEREETIRELQLVVKGCRNIYESLDKFCEVEMMDGENKYNADGHGLQDARKGIKFKTFPPVLQLHLLRFEYDFQRDVMVKVNDRYEFPERLDLDIEGGKYFSRNAEGRSAQNVYRLYSVLVHSGGVHGGHYYAYIRPNVKGSEWFRFDDEKVTKEDEKSATSDQFGEDDVHFNPQQNQLNHVNNNRFNTIGGGGKYSNAYMLVYVRESEMDGIFRDVEKRDIAQHLQERFQREHEERERRMKEKAEAHLYSNVRVAMESDLREHTKTNVFDLVNHDQVKNFRVKKEMRFSDFKALVEEELQVPVAAQRYWLWAKRQNQTFRPSNPLTDEEELKPVGEISGKNDSRNGARNYQSTELRLFLEVMTPADGARDSAAIGGSGFMAPIGNSAVQDNGAFMPSPNPIPEKTILLFFKLYSPLKKSIEYVGHLFVPANGVMASITPHLLRMGNFHRGTELLIFEEIKFEPVMCEVVDVHSTFAKLQLENGDIICFQEACHENVIGVEYPTVPSFMQYTSNKLDVRFRKLEDARRGSGAQESDSDIVIELGKDFSYDQIVSALAQGLNLADPDRLRLSPYDTYTQQPKAAVKHRGVERLSDLLQNYAQTTDIVFYEILSMPLPKLERMRFVGVDFFARGQIATHQVQVPMDDESFTVLSLAQELSDKVVPESTVPVERLRLLDVYHSKIRRVFEPADKMTDIIDKSLNLRLEEVPTADMVLKEADRVVHWYHVTGLPQPSSPDAEVVDMETATPGKDQGLIHSNNDSGREMHAGTIHVHGDPLLVVIRPGDTLKRVKGDVQSRLNVADEDFQSWRFHIVTESATGVTTGPIDDGTDVSRIFSAYTAPADGGATMYIGMEHSAAKGPHRSQTCQLNSSARHTHERPVRIYT